MAVDRVPWAVSTPGVEHDAALARVANFLASGPKRGIVPAGTASGAATATSPASGGVQVAPMVAVAPNTYPGRFGESYVLRNLSSTVVPIRATGSGGGRSDVVIFRVDDPALGGGTVADVSTHDFARFEVIENVPASVVSASQLASTRNLHYPFVWVARVTLPASTATVTASMIDTTGRVQIGGQKETAVRTRLGDIGGINLNSKDTEGQLFPSTGGQHAIMIPEWATRMQIRCEWTNVVFTAGGNAHGDFWVTFGSSRTQRGAFDTSNANDAHIDHWLLADDVAIPEGMRGTVQPFTMRARLGGSATLGVVQMIPRSGTILTVEFRESL